MKDLSIYFASIEHTLIPDEKETLGSAVRAFIHDFPELDEVQLAIFGVCDDRNGHQLGSAAMPDKVRPDLYRLANQWGDDLRVADLGNILPGETPEDTCHAVRDCVEELRKRKIIPVIIGGSQDLTLPVYQGYANLERSVNLVSVDPALDIQGVTEENVPLNASSFLGKVILHQPALLFNLSVMGIQGYYFRQSHQDIMNKLFFDYHRLGDVQSDMAGAEPILRNADIVSFDMSSVRASDAPGTDFSNPNGFTGQEACRIMRYAAISDKVSSIGLFNGNPTYDDNNRTSRLMGQMVWFVIDGFMARKGDDPITRKDEYTRYTVTLNEGEHEIVFYKSPFSDRWWMEVPYPPDKRIRFTRHLMVPCNYRDYEHALEDEMPDLWWKTYQKLIL